MSVTLKADIEIKGSDQTKEAFGSAETSADKFTAVLDKIAQHWQQIENKTKKVNIKGKLEDAASGGKKLEAQIDFIDKAWSKAQAKFGKITVKKGWQETVTALSTAYLALRSIVSSVSHTMLEPVKAALATEKAVYRLNTILSVTGRSVGVSAAAMDEYLGKLELLTGVDDSVIASVMAQNVAFGMSAKQAMLAGEAMAILTKLGVDYAAANEMLIRTFNGEVRSLKQYVPEVQNLTQSQLRAGAAVDIIIAKLGYLNKSAVSTGAVALQRFGTQWDNFTKAIGQAIIGGVNWEKAYKRVSEIFERLSMALGINRDKLGRVGEWLAEQGIDLFERFAKMIENTLPHIDKVIRALEKLKDTFIVIAGTIGTFGLRLLELLARVGGDRQAAAAVAALRQEVDKFAGESLGKFTGLTGAARELKTELTGFSGIKLPSFKSAYDATARKVGLPTMDETSEPAPKPLKRGALEMAVHDAYAAGGHKADEVEQRLGKLNAMIITVRENAKQGESEAAKQKEKFAGKPLTVDPNAARKRQEVMEQISAIEREQGDKSLAEFHGRLAQIQKLERDAKASGVRESAKFDQMRERAAMQYATKRQEIEARVAASSDDTNADLSTKYMDRLKQIEELQKEASANGIDAEKQMNEERLRAFDEYMEERKERERQAQLEIAKIVGDIRKQADIEAEVERAEIEQAYKKKTIDMPEKVRALDAVTAKQEVKYQGSAGIEWGGQKPEVWDARIIKFNNVMNSAQGGLNSILQTLLTMFGGLLGGLWGQIIAFFNQPPEQFFSMIEGIVQQMIDFVPNVMENIPQLFEILALGIPDIIVSILGNLLNVRLWVSFFTRIVHAIGDLLQGLFVAAVFGRSLRKEVRAKERAAGMEREAPAKFGSDQPDAGEGKFKIRDADQRQKAKTDTYVDVIDKVTEEETHNFVYYILEGLKGLEKIIRGWAETFIREITKFFEDPVGTIVGWAKKIGKLLANALGDLNPFNNIDAENLSPALLGALQKAFNEINMENIKGAFVDFKDGVSRLYTALVENPLVQTLFEAGEKLVTALTNNPIADALKEAGNKLISFATTDLPQRLQVAGDYVAMKWKEIEPGIIAAGQGFGDNIRNAGLDFANQNNLTSTGFVANVSIAGQMISTAGQSLLGNASLSGSVIAASGTALVNNFLTAYNTFGAPALVRGGENIIAGFMTKLNVVWPNFDIAGKNIGAGMIGSINNFWPNFENAGKNLYIGFQNGFLGFWDNFKKAGSNIASGFKDGVKGVTSGGGAVFSGFHAGGYVPARGDRHTAALWDAMGALRAQEGLLVPGAGIGDKVPILAEPGERVLNRAETKAYAAGGNQTTNVSFTFNVAAGATFDKVAANDLADKVIDVIKRKSKNGVNVIRPGGVY